jgi:hypothetical protein
MEKINIGIITNLRKLLFAYRILFSEHIQSPANIVLEATSIDSISSNSHINERPELLLIDYRLVFKDTALFFSFVNYFYPDTVILLVVHQTFLCEAKRCTNYVQSVLSPNLDINQLFMLIRNSILQSNIVKQ